MNSSFERPGVGLTEIETQAPAGPEEEEAAHAILFGFVCFLFDLNLKDLKDLKDRNRNRNKEQKMFIVVFFENTVIKVV